MIPVTLRIDPDGYLVASHREPHTLRMLRRRIRSLDDLGAFLCYHAWQAGVCLDQICLAAMPDVLHPEHSEAVRPEVADLCREVVEFCP